MKQSRNADELEKRVAEDIWLNYFNKYLYEHGTISDKIEKIAKRKAVKDRGRG